MTLPEENSGVQSRVEKLRASNTAFTPNVDIEAQSSWSEDFRTFDLSQMTMFAESSPIGENALRRSLEELQTDSFFSPLIQSSTIRNNEGLESLIRELPIPSSQNNDNWIKQNIYLSRRGITGDRIRQAATYGIKQLLSALPLTQERTSLLNNVVEHTQLYFRDEGGSRGGWVLDGPTVIFNLGLELGKLGWVRELINLEVSNDATFVLGVSSLAHEEGHAIDRSKILLNDGSVQWSEEFDLKQTGLPIAWEDESRTGSKQLCRKESFAEGFARGVLTRLNLDMTVVKDFRRLYYSWALAHLLLINPTDLSRVYESAQRLVQSHQIARPVYSKIESMYQVLDGHPFAIGHHMNQEQVSNVLNS